MSSTEVSVLRPVTPLGILADRLERLRSDLSTSAGVDPGTIAELDQICALASGLDPYIDRCTTPASQPLRTLAERTEQHDWGNPARSPVDAGADPGVDDPDLRSGTEKPLGLEAEMLSGHLEGRFLAFLVRLGRATSVLEVGMFTGYSALAMAEAVPDGGRVVACEIDPDVAVFARRCFDESPHGVKIRIEVAPAIETLRALASAGDTFDFVFIDADKAGYGDYLDVLLDDGLLAPEGVICVDNTLMQGLPYLQGESTPNGEAIAAFNDKVVADDRVEQVLLPVRDGVTLIRRV